MAAFEHRFDMRSMLRQAVKLAQRHRALPLYAMHLDGCVKRHKRYRKVGGISSDAVIARPKHRVPSILTPERSAARTWRSLVACDIADIAEVWASSALQEITAHRCLVSNLWTCRVQQRFGDDRKLADDGWVRGNLSHGGGSADLQALRAGFDTAVKQTRQTHQRLWSAYIFLEELHHVGATCDVFGGRVITACLGTRGQCSGKITRAFKGKWVHRLASRTIDSSRV